MLKANQEVEVRWGSKNKEWFIDKGYLFTKHNDVFIVRAEDLMATSKIRLIVICDICKENEYEISQYALHKSESKQHICKPCNKTKSIIIVNCHTCEDEFKSTAMALNKSKSGYLFCSNSCVGLYNGKTRVNQIKKQCLICDDQYSVIPANSDTSVACSVECQNKWQSKYLVGENANNFKGGERDKDCENCGDVFTCDSPYQYLHRKYCGVECRQEYWKNHTITSKSFNLRCFEGNAEYREKIAGLQIETKPERMMRKYLESIGLVKDQHFFQERGFMRKYFVDFYIPKGKIIIEVHGDYWHGNPEIYGEGKKPLNVIQINRMEKDIAKRDDFVKNGYTYIEVWEKDIYEDINVAMKEICL